MKCARCGEIIYESSKRCPSCGLKIRLQQPPSTPMVSGSGGQTGVAVLLGDSRYAPGEVVPLDQRYPPGSTPVEKRVVSAGFAGFWLRYVAAWIDVFVVLVLIVPFALGLGATGYAPSIIAITPITLIIIFGYLIFMTGRYGATLGKMLLKIKVVRTDGSELGYGTAAVRELSKIISYMICGIGFYMAGFDSNKQALHDKIASTVAVKLGR